ncbi:MAG TPA: hypothetical protein VKT78_15170 [Fimbriimonadaceae bacterium]|nr:hypothetical protein [Fimbriimonadaceae bacterium]
MIRDPIERLRWQRGGFVDRPFLTRMTAPEVVDVSIRGYQALAWTFLRHTIVPTLFCVAAWLFVFHYLGTLFNTKETEPWKQAGELTIKLAMSLGVALPIFLIGVSWSTAVITSLASDWILDRVPNGNAAASRALQLLPKMTSGITRLVLTALGACLVSLLLLFVSQLIPDNSSTGYTGLIAALAIFGLIIGGLIALYVAIIHSLVPAIIVMEGIKPSQAGKRSRSLLSSTDSRRQNPAQASILLLLLVVSFSAVATWAAWSTFEGLANLSEGLRNWMAGSVINTLAVSAFQLVPVFLVLWLVMPIWSLGTVATYYATRIRIEGYDIDLLTAEVAQQDKRARFEI